MHRFPGAARIRPADVDGDPDVAANGAVPGVAILPPEREASDQTVTPPDQVDRDGGLRVVLQQRRAYLLFASVCGSIGHSSLEWYGTTG